MKFSKNILFGLGLVTLLAVTNVSASSQVVGLENDPIFKDFQKLHHDMNKIFERFNEQFYNDLKIDDKFFKDSTFSLKADLKDKGDYYEVKVDLPGVEKSETNVKVSKSVLSIDAKSEKSVVDKNDKMIKKERSVGVFHRSMILPSDADGEKLTTTYKDGVLTIKIPKK
jgi:HSP20 family protein